jgi:hypothetical protein
VQSSILHGACGGPVFSLGYNIETDDCLDGAADPTDLVDTEPAFENEIPEHHGGETPTISLSAAAPQDFAEACLPTDQRLVARPSVCDAGAYERTETD